MAAYQPDAGDATAVSAVRGDCTMGDFDGCQKLVEMGAHDLVRWAAFRHRRETFKEFP